MATPAYGSTEYQKILQARPDLQTGLANYGKSSWSPQTKWEQWYLKNGVKEINPAIYQTPTAPTMPTAPTPVAPVAQAPVMPTYTPTVQAPVAPIAQTQVTPQTPASTPVIPTAPTAPTLPTFSFDTASELAKVRQQATSIYDPQRQLLDIQSQIEGAKTEQQKVETKEQFSKLLKSEIESINARGAFFSGGALTREGDIRMQEQRTIDQINLQQMAQNAQLMAQKGLLSTQEADYIQQKLTDAESSAYNRFISERNWQYGVYRDKVADWQEDRDFIEAQYRGDQDVYFKEKAFEYEQFRDRVSDFIDERGFQYQQYRDKVGDEQADRDFARGVLESDRAFDQSVEEFKKTYKLDKGRLDLAKKEYKLNKKKYGSDTALEIAKLELQKKKQSSDNNNNTTDDDLTKILKTNTNETNTDGSTTQSTNSPAANWLGL